MISIEKLEEELKRQTGLSLDCALERDIGFCTSCARVHQGIRRDAENRPCFACGKPTVGGICTVAMEALCSEFS